MYDTKCYWEYRAKALLSPNSANSVMTVSHREFLRRMIHKYKPCRLLEFGAGVGRLFSEYADIRELTICDVSPTYLEESRSAANRLGLRAEFYLCPEVDVTPFVDEKFDIVVAVSVLLHQRPEDIESVMSELARISRKVVVISWCERESLVDKVTRNTHCYMHDYHSLCCRNGWEMQDIEYVEHQIYFTYGKHYHNIARHLKENDILNVL